MSDMMATVVWVTCVLLAACWSFYGGHNYGYRKGLSDMASIVSDVFASMGIDVLIDSDGSATLDQNGTEAKHDL